MTSSETACFVAMLMCAMCRAGLPTAIPRRNQPREVQTELLKTVLLHEQGQNTDASVTLLYSESINDNSVLRASISAHANVFDMMGALMLACRGFQGGDIAQKLEYLEIMKILNDEDAATENFLQHEIKSAESSEAARLARYGQTPICFQGQRKTLIDLIATDPAELLAYFAGEMHARWSNGHFPLRRPHPEELGNFPSR